MLTSCITLFALAAWSAMAADPEPLEKRQNIPQLLAVASAAGLTLPTDPAVILGLGGVAKNLAEALPTPAVLSVLLTAAPPSFISNIVHDQSFANSFESAFAAGSSPSWFNALPTDVKSYLHTYSGFGGLAQAANAVESGAIKATSQAGTKLGSAASATATTATTGQSASSATATTKSSAASSAAATSATSISAARLTEALGASLLGVVGILVLVIAL